MELIVLVWIFSAAIVGTIAKAKGRSFIAWTLLGAIFGIFALVYIVFASRRVRV